MSRRRRTRNRVVRLAELTKHAGLADGAPGRAGQGRDLVECPLELFYGFDQCRTGQRPLSGLAPQTRSFLDQASFAAVTRQKLRPVVGYPGNGRLSFPQREHGALDAVRAAACHRLRPAQGRA